jgi:transposase
MRFDLSDEDWALLEPLLPKSRKSARVDDRKIMNAIFYVLRTGMPWRDLPARYGPYTTAYNRFNRWSRRGIWKRVFDLLASKSRDSLYLIDSTIVKPIGRQAAQKGGEKSSDRHRGSLLLLRTYRAQCHRSFTRSVPTTDCNCTSGYQEISGAATKEQLSPSRPLQARAEHFQPQLGGSATSCSRV